MVKDKYKDSFAALLTHHMHNGTRPDGNPSFKGRSWTIKELALLLFKDEGGARNIRNWRNGKNLPSDLHNLEQAFFGENKNWSRQKLEFRARYFSEKLTKPRNADKKANSFKISFAPLAREDTVEIGVSHAEVENYLEQEAQRHSITFKDDFDSLPFYMGENLFIATKQSDLIIVERIIKTSDAYPLISIWASTLSQYRIAKSMGYRGEDGVYDLSQYKHILNNSLSLVNALSRYCRSYGLFFGHVLDITSITELYNEARTYADLDRQDRFIVAVEALLSNVHKILLNHIPRIVGSNPTAGSVIDVVKYSHKDFLDKEISSDAKTILLVEDDEGANTMLTRIISYMGIYCVYSVKDGHDALSFLVNERVDIVITDIVMPSLDGLALVRVLNRVYPDIKIIMISGYAQMRNEAASNANLKAAAVLPKPFDFETLRYVVQRSDAEWENTSISLARERLEQALEEWRASDLKN